MLSGSTYQRERSMQQNAWNIQFERNGKLVIRVFEGDSPKGSGATDFARELLASGISCNIISRRHAFPPTGKHVDPPGPGLLWCPYCIKWREFEEAAVVRAEYETPELMRCTVCTISIRDYYVRLYNPIIVERMEIEREMKKAKAPNRPVLRRRRR